MKFFLVLEEPVVDLADPADHGQMTVAVADIGLRTGDVGGQPLAVLKPEQTNPGGHARS